MLAADLEDQPRRIRHNSRSIAQTVRRLVVLAVDSYRTCTGTSATRSFSRSLTQSISQSTLKPSQCSNGNSRSIADALNPFRPACVSA